MNQPPTSSHYREYVRLLKQLHTLIAAGQGETEEANRIREAMDEPWRFLTGDEIDRVRGLSADLYTLSPDAPISSPARSPGESQLRRDLASAARRHDWNEALALLRKRPEFLSRDQVAYLRGKYWQELGDPETALLFYEEAARLSPGNAFYSQIILHVLVHLGRLSEAEQRARPIISNAKSVDRFLLMQAARAVLLWGRSLPEPDARPVWRELLTAYEDARIQESALPENSVSARFKVVVRIGIGTCHELLGENDRAAQAYRDALAVDPDDDAALTSLGLLCWESDQSEAIAALATAVERNTPLVWPYYYLAKHALREGDHARCLELISKAQQRTDDAELQGALCELMAIAQFELRFPAEVVRKSFELAVALDPLSERIRENLRIFEEHLSKNGDAGTRWLTSDPHAAVTEARRRDLAYGPPIAVA